MEKVTPFPFVAGFISLYVTPWPKQEEPEQPLRHLASQDISATSLSSQWPVKVRW